MAAARVVHVEGGQRSTQRRRLCDDKRGDGGVVQPVPRDPHKSAGDTWRHAVVRDSDALSDAWAARVLQWIAAERQHLRGRRCAGLHELRVRQALV